MNPTVTRGSVIQIETMNNYGSRYIVFWYNFICKPCLINILKFFCCWKWQPLSIKIGFAVIRQIKSKKKEYIDIKAEKSKVDKLKHNPIQMYK